LDKKKGKVPSKQILPFEKQVSMAKLHPYVGTYTRTGNKLEGTTTFLLTQRPDNKITPNKPKHYLLELDEAERRSYFSSLYPTATDDTFRVEKDGTWYLVRVLDHEVVFSSN